MTDHFDVSTLNWLKGEIGETLKQARIALEKYAENPEDEAQIHFCSVHLHQVAGTLQMVELFGAARFAAEMERLADSLPRLNPREPAFEVLMRTILLLPDYLELLQSGEQDNPIILLPLINELRLAHGEAELTSVEIFQPDLRVQPPAAGTPLVDINELAHKLRPHYQAALVNILKAADVVPGAKIMAAVFEKLRNGSPSPELRRIFWAGEALAEALRDGGLPLDAPIKPLLAKLDQVIKQAAMADASGADASALQDPLRAILFELGRTASAGPRVTEVRRAFCLDALLPSPITLEQIRSGMGGFNAELKQTVSRDVLEELSRIKDVLDLFSRNPERPTGDLATISTGLAHIADVLGVVKQNALGERLRAQATQVDEVAQGNQPAHESLLMEVAASVLSVEVALSGWGSVAPLERSDDMQAADVEPDGVGSQAEHRRIIRQVMKEAKDDLVKAREAINGYVQKPGENSAADVPRLMKQIIGSLSMLSYERVAQVLRACRSFVEQQIVGKDKMPPAAQLDALADAMMSVEYYLDAFVESRVHPSSVLDVAEKAVATLGYPVESIEEEPPETIIVTPPEAPPGEIDSLGEHTLDEIIDLDLSLQAMEAAPEAISHTPSSVDQGVAESWPETDDEIIDIFVEEAEEEIQKIGELLPLWKSNPSDHGALRDLRRSFHTLKGSGRLVGAKELGEFAWAFENLLNRVIDGDIDVGAAVFDILEEAHSMMPGLLAHFRGGSAPRDYMNLQEAAFVLAQSAKPDVQTPAPAQSAAVPIGVLEISDPVLRDIYTKEAEIHLESLKAFVAGCHSRSCRANDTLIRALHTLCGSSRTAGVSTVAELSSQLEKCARACQSNGMPVDADVLSVLSATAAYVESVVKSLRGEQISPDLGDLPAQAAQLLATIEAQAAKSREQARDSSADEDAADLPQFPDVGEAADFANEEVHVGTDGSEVNVVGFPSRTTALPLVESPEEESGAAVGAFPGDPASNGEEPWREHFLPADVSVEPIPSTDQNAFEPAENMEADLQGEPAAGSESWAIREELEPTPESEVMDGSLVASDARVEPSLRWQAASSSGEDHLHDSSPREAAVRNLTLADEHEAFAAEAGDTVAATSDSASLSGHPSMQAAEMDATAGAPDDAPVAQEEIGSFESTPTPGRESTEVFEIYTSEAGDLLSTGDDLLHDWSLHPGDRRPVESLQRVLHTLKGSARWAGETSMADLGHMLESTYAAIVQGRLPASREVMEVAHTTHSQLKALLNEYKGGEKVSGTLELIAKLRALATPDQADDSVLQVRDYDPELLSIFLEEGQEILNACDEILQAWSAAPQEKSFVETLQRQLHTLKGGARMAGVPEIGDLGHGLESMLAGVADGMVTASPQMLALLQQAQDRLAVMLEQLRNNDPLPGGEDLISAIEALVSGRDPASEAAAASPVPSPDSGITVSAFAGDEASEPLSLMDAEDNTGVRDRRQGPRTQYELVRVRSDLLDSMVNVAGEASIFRSRVEQQIGGFRGNLEDLNQIIERLRERLRMFDIETEAQIQSRHEEAAQRGYEDFDPLEFDRFTNMQQFSRSMVESLGDLGSVGTSLSGLTRETETLLVQQARVNTELQEGLMHTRMVPLVQHAPRLRRIVRQTCEVLGKEAELRFRGAEVEMDRNVVERIMAPLEHLLRNAIAHGIEPVDVREAGGKTRSGTVVIEQMREGTEVVVRVIDDGAGINVSAVREKAIARGLMEPAAHLDDKDVLLFILEAGFSTAESLTQIAGRGVGMDVVNSEVKSLNGSLTIDSKLGKGTTFTIRLPMTLTVSRALLVYAGEDLYAIPLLSIEGIVRASDEEIAELLSGDSGAYRWLGQDYDVLQLSAILGIENSVRARETEERRQAILLAHSGEHRVAIVVDGLIGSREIVVKPVGRQLGSLRGLSGATILGDGRVALILEVPGLIRLGLVRHGDKGKTVEPESPITSGTRPTIMVVDDSITVRKVTSRLLERSDMNSVSAKDGMEAVSLLQDTIPDVMLLDIEMPRMDGYELATHVRNEPRLRDVPIIMITSRSGEKHRQRAIQIGVDIYMTKPFQESELLANIRTLLQEHRPRGKSAAR